MADIDNDTSYPVTTTPASTDQVVIINKATGLLAKTAFSNAHKGLTIPVCALKKTAVQSVANNTDTALTWDYEVCDPENMHSNVTNNSRITCATAGIYLVTAQVAFAADADGVRNLDIYLNGALKARVSQPGSAGGNALCISFVYVAAANEYFEVYVLHTAGANLDIGGASNYQSNFSVTLLRAGSYTIGSTT